MCEDVSFDLLLLRRLALAMDVELDVAVLLEEGAGAQQEGAEVLPDSKPPYKGKWKKKRAKLLAPYNPYTGGQERTQHL